MTTADSERLELALARIDEANFDDPNTIVIEGEVRPKELEHAVMMTDWVMRLDPDADDAQLIAARAHHLRRWSIPRDEYPEGRSGYLRWRTALKKQHAQDVAVILRECGYDSSLIDRVERIVRKDGLGRDLAVQTHEDALCLVFLQTQFAELADRLGDDRTVDVVRKTLGKMSPSAVALALDLPLSGHARELVERAGNVE